jgi:signal transduction histidine kinase
MALLSNNIESLEINFKKQQLSDDSIEKVKNTSKQLLQTLREAIWILNKEQVAAQEFFDKLIDYTQRYLQSYPQMQLQVKEKFTGKRVLNSNEALQLFRICQEAVTNACKYSASESLLLHGVVTGNYFIVTIQDFGKGFDSEEVSKSGHYGLKNMRQRAATIAATIKIEAAVTKGVSITVTI